MLMCTHPGRFFRCCFQSVCLVLFSPWKSGNTNAQISLPTPFLVSSSFPPAHIEDEVWSYLGRYQEWQLFGLTVAARRWTQTAHFAMRNFWAGIGAGLHLMNEQSWAKRQLFWATDGGKSQFFLSPMLQSFSCPIFMSFSLNFHGVLGGGVFSA